MVFTPVNTYPVLQKRQSVLGMGASPERTFSSIGPNFNSIHWMLPTWQSPHAPGLFTNPVNTGRSQPGLDRNPGESRFYSEEVASPNA
jgi:hypothetical protein